MIKLKNSVFLHVPKTGGKWVSSILTSPPINASVMKGTKNVVVVGHSIHNIEYDLDKPCFCFVRHPLSWYRSYWSFRWATNTWNRTHNNNLLPMFDMFCKDHNFATYVDKVISWNEHNGSVLNSLYGYFTPHCDFIGRQETLQEDLERVLSLYEGITLKDFPDKKNESPSLVKFNPGQLDKLMKLDRSIIDQFNYDYIPDEFQT